MGARGPQLLALLACSLCALALAAALALGAPAHATTRRRAAAHHTSHQACRAHARTRAPAPAHERTRSARPAAHPASSHGRAAACRPAPRSTRAPAGAPAAGSGAAGSSPGAPAAPPAGEGSGAPAPGEAPQTLPPSIPHVQVTAVEYHFTLSRTTVPRGKVIFELVNNGQDEHNLNVLPGEGPSAGAFPNTPAKGVFDQEIELRPGTYTLFCSLPEHEQKGMKSTLVVE